MSEGIWTMTDTEFYSELAKAWDEGALWRHHASGRHNGGLQWFQRGYPDKPIDAPNPYAGGAK